MPPIRLGPETNALVRDVRRARIRLADLIARAAQPPAA
jgi:hypothetical protein